MNINTIDTIAKVILDKENVIIINKVNDYYGWLQVDRAYWKRYWNGKDSVSLQKAADFMDDVNNSDKGCSACGWNTAQEAVIDYYSESVT